MLEISIGPILHSTSSWSGWAEYLVNMLFVHYIPLSGPGMLSKVSALTKWLNMRCREC